MGIICTECDEERLGVLHKHNILPKQVTCCGLISQSNAERLLKLFNSANVETIPGEVNNNSTSTDKINLDSAAYHQIRVTHDCFGQQKGIIFPLKYTHSNAQCIECLECSRMMCPSDFVGHTHQEFGSKWTETQVCHWGFDSTNWRWYLRLSEDCTRTKLEEESLNDYLDEIKKRFCTSISELPPRRWAFIIRVFVAGLEYIINLFIYHSPVLTLYPSLVFDPLKHITTLLFILFLWFVTYLIFILHTHRYSNFEVNISHQYQI